MVNGVVGAVLHEGPNGCWHSRGLRRAGEFLCDRKDGPRDVFETRERAFPSINLDVSLSTGHTCTCVSVASAYLYHRHREGMHVILSCEHNVHVVLIVLPREVAPRRSEVVFAQRFMDSDVGQMWVSVIVDQEVVLKFLSQM